MFNNILPAAITTAVITVGSFLTWCIGIGANGSYFFEGIPAVFLATVFLAAMWALSEGDVFDYQCSE